MASTFVRDDGVVLREGSRACAAVIVCCLGVCCLGVGCLGGCFVGSDAAGLPCNVDLDCGLDDKCVEGFCGGPPATVTTATTTDDPTTESSSGPEPTTGEPTCDGPSLQCEPAMPDVSDAMCDRDCTFPACGDGLWNEHAANDAFSPPQGNEQCDEGVQGTPQDAVDCDADCTLVACGDDHYNALGEPCDDGNEEDFDACTSACQVPVIAERFDTEVWTSEPYDLSSYARTAWGSGGPDTDSTGWVWTNGEWRSGVIPYRDALFETFQFNYAGVTRLVSDPRNLPALEDVPEGATLELRFSHAMVIENECSQDPARSGDGGVVHLIEMDGTEHKLVPIGGYPGTLTDVCSDEVPEHKPNPLFVERAEADAFTGADAIDGDVRIDLGEHAGKPGVRIAFDFGTDCIHCVDENFSPSSWQIDDVIVAVFPP